MRRIASSAPASVRANRSSFATMIPSLWPDSTRASALRKSGRSMLPPDSSSSTCVSPIGVAVQARPAVHLLGLDVGADEAVSGAAADVADSDVGVEVQDTRDTTSGEVDDPGDARCGFFGATG